MSLFPDPAHPRHLALPLAVPVLLMVFFSCRGDGRSQDGPLEGSLAGEVGIPVEVGQAVTVGYASLFNSGTSEATVEHVRLLPENRVELVGVRTLLLPRDGGGIISLPEYPPKDYPSRPLPEQGVVPGAAPRPPGEPEPNLELVLGVRAAGPGVFRSEEVEVTYIVGNRRFIERFPVTITLCAPAAAYFTQCDANTEPKA